MWRGVRGRGMDGFGGLGEEILIFDFLEMEKDEEKKSVFFVPCCPS